MIAGLSRSSRGSSIIIFSWSLCTKCWCGNWRVTFGAWLLVQLLQPLLLVEVWALYYYPLSFQPNLSLTIIFGLFHLAFAGEKRTRPLLFFEGIWTNLAAWAMGGQKMLISYTLKTQKESLQEIKERTIQIRRKQQRQIKGERQGRTKWQPHGGKKKNKNSLVHIHSFINLFYCRYRCLKESTAKYQRGGTLRTSCSLSICSCAGYPMSDHIKATLPSLLFR